ncbi:hypothetical protein GCM10010401_17460 [Rarobacter faecitabidus]|uniref:Putative membrane protein n=1 Tax=Rarobacter faecitabidus TaxID=13243 RepID=A0A542ZUC6_RARFA|nr:hypothetical protein [Rarobacter faecitabidus]TQL63958.1 putative membrane protein [Rarobacter faecitabidus]
MGLWCNQMGAGGWAAMIALWVAVLAGVIWAVCRMFPTPQRRAERDLDPQALLDARLAAGEMDPETYRSLRSHLADSSHLAGSEPVTTKGPR